MPCDEQSSVVFQEGPPVCWLFLPGRLFVGRSAVIGKTIGWPISSSIVTAASDKARPASRKPEIYPPAFHHSFTINAQRERERKRGSVRGITGTWINKNHMGSIQMVRCTHKHVHVLRVHKPAKPALCWPALIDQLTVTHTQTQTTIFF